MDDLYDFECYCDQADITETDRNDFRDWFLEGPHTLDELMSLVQWDCQWEEFTGEPLNVKEVTSFEVELNGGPDMGGAIIELVKEGDRWNEYVLSASPDFYWPGASRYMSYLKPEDILVWLRKDFDSARITENTLTESRVEEEEDTYFEIEVNGGPDEGGALLAIEKEDGKWVEWVLDIDPLFRGHCPTKTYMGYLTKSDIMSWLRSDFDTVRLCESMLQESDASDFYKKGAEVSRDGDVWLRGSANDAEPQMYKVRPDSAIAQKYKAIAKQVEKDNPQLYNRMTFKNDIQCDIRPSKKEPDVYGIFGDGEKEPSEEYLVLNNNKIVKEEEIINRRKRRNRRCY